MTECQSQVVYIKEETCYGNPQEFHIQTVKLSEKIFIDDPNFEVSKEATKAGKQGETESAMSSLNKKVSMKKKPQIPW